jgi:hypothetical protein
MATRFYLLALALGIVGIWGFLSGGPLLGTFEVTALLNVLHLIAAIAAAAAAMRGLGTMRAVGRMLGYVLGALATAAFAMEPSSLGGVLPLSNSNAWFHLLMSLVFLYHALLAPPTL